MAFLEKEMRAAIFIEKNSLLFRGHRVGDLPVSFRYE
jgi:hypothetical protein